MKLPRGLKAGIESIHSATSYRLKLSKEETPRFLWANRGCLIFWSNQGSLIVPMKLPKPTPACASLRPSPGQAGAGLQIPTSKTLLFLFYIFFLFFTRTAVGRLCEARSEL